MRFINWLDRLRTRAKKSRRGIGRPTSRALVAGLPSIDIARRAECLEDRTLLAIAVNLFVSVNAGTEVDSTLITVIAATASPVSGAQTVNVAVTDSTTNDLTTGGIRPGDFILSSGVISIANNTIAGSVTFTVQNDDIVEAFEEIAKLTISSPSAGLELGGQTTQLFTITDNDQAVVSIAPASEDEGTSLGFVVSLSKQVDVAVSASADSSETGTTAKTADGDYTAVITSVSFPALSTTNQTVTVNTTSDNKVEDNETLSLILSALSASGRNVIFNGGGGILTGAGTINNDDSANLTLSIPSITETNADQTVNATVTLSAPVQGGFDAPFSTATVTAENGDITFVTSSPLSFAGTSGEVENIQLTIKGDTIVEDNETFTITLGLLSGITSEQISSITGVGSPATGTINNDDKAVLMINDVTANENGTFSFTVTSSNATEEDITGTVNTANIAMEAVAGTDYTAISGGTFTITGNSSAKTDTVTVTVDDDNIVEDDETFNVDLTNARFNGMLDASRATYTGGDAQGLGTITNNDTAVLEIDDVTELENGTFTFTVSSSNPTDTNITGTINTANIGGQAVAGTDYTAISGATFTITGDSSDLIDTFAVTVANDRRVEGTETFNVNLSAPKFGVAEDLGRATFTGGDAQSLATITDNDTAVIAFTDPTATAAENNTDLLVDVTITLSDTGTGNYAVDGTVNVDVNDTGGNAIEGTDFSFSDVSDLTINGISISTGVETIQLPLSVIEDLFIEGDETAVLSLLGLNDSTGQVSLGQATHTLTITDDDSAGEAKFDLTGATGPTFTLSIVGGNVQLTDNGGNVIGSQVAGASNSLMIAGTDANNDNFVIDFVGGNPAPSGGISVDGGTGGSDSLELANVGTTFGTHTYNYTNANDGSVVLSVGDDATINYEGLEPLTVGGMGNNLIFNLPGTADPNITLANDGAELRLSSATATFEATNFDAPNANGSITINLGADDQIIGVSTLTLNNNTDLTINGDGGSDTVNVAAALNVTGDLAVVAEAITQAGTLTVGGTSSFTAGAGNSFTLNSANDFQDTVTVVSGDDVTLRDANAIDFGASTISGNFQITAGGAITDSGAVTVTGTTNIVNAGNDVTFSNAGNDFTGAVTVTGAAVTLVDASNLQFAGVTATSLDATATDALTDAIGTTLAISNNASFSGSSITLGDDGGDSTNFGTLTVNSAGAVVVTEDSNVVFAGSGAGASSAGSLTINTTGNITDGDNADMTITNLAFFNAGAVVTIGNNGGNTANFGTLRFAGTSVTIDESSATALALVNSASSLNLDSAGAITDGSTSVTVTNNADFDGTSITVGGGGITTNFGSLTFNSTGAVSVQEDSSTTVSAASTAGGAGLTLSSVDNVTLNGTVGVTGNTSITSGTTSNGLIDVNSKLTGSGTILLDAATSIIIDAAVDPTTVTMQADDDITINAAVAATTLITLTAGIDNTGSVIVNDSLTTTDAGSDITITTGSTTGAITLNGDVTAVDRVTLTSNGTGNVSQTGGEIAAGELQVTAVGNATLNQAANNVGTIAADLNPGIFQYTDAASLIVGSLGTAGIATGNGGDGGAVTINATSGTITVSNPITTTPGTGGGVVLTGAVTLNAALTAAGGTITLNGNAGATGDIIVSSAITSDATIDFDAPQDVIINAVVTTTGAGSDIRLTADSVSDGRGGVLITAIGQVDSIDEVTMEGSDGINGAFTTGVQAIEVISDGTNVQVLAGGNVLIQDKASAPAASDTVINGRIATDLAAATITITGEQDVTFGAAGDVISLGGAVTVTADTRAGNNGGVLTMNNNTLIDGAGGTIDIDADGRITLGSVQTAAGTVQINSTSGSVVDGGDAAIDVLGLTVQILALTGIGTDANDIDTTVGAIGASTDSGDIHVTDTDDITVGTSSGTSGLTIADAVGGGDDSTDDNITIAATAGSVTISQPIANNDAGTVIVRASDDIFLTSSITTNNGDVTLNSDRDADSDGGIDLTGGSVTSAGGDITLGGGANPATTAAFGNANTGGEGVAIQNGSSLSAAAGNISIRGTAQNTAGSQGILSVTGTNTIQTTSGNITMVGTAPANANRGVDLQGAGVSVISTVGDISITGTSTSTIANGEGVSLDTNASIQSSSGTITITGSSANDNAIDLTAGTSVTATAAGDINMAATGDLFTASSVDSNGGAISLVGDADIDNDGTILSGGGTVTVTADNDIAMSAAGSIDTEAGSTAMVTITADDDGAGGGGISLTDGSFVDARDGNVTLTATDDIDISLIRSTATIIITSTAGAITDSDAGAGLDIDREGSAALRAETGIGSDADPLETSLGTVAARTDSGDIHLVESDSLIVGTVNALNGLEIQDTVNNNSTNDNITVITNDALTVNQLVINRDAGNIVLTVQGGLATSDMNLNADVTATGGNGNITLNADDSILQAATSDVTAAGTGFIDYNAGNDIVMADGAEASSGTGLITMDAPGDITLGSVSTNNTTLAAVTINAGGDIIDGGDLQIDISVIQAGSGVILNAVGGIGDDTPAGLGATPAIDTTIVELDASVSGNGSIDIDETNAILLTDLDTANGSIQVDAGGAITATDVQSSTDNNANDIRLQAATGNIQIVSIRIGNAATANNGDVIVVATTGAITEANAATNAKVIAEGFRVVAGGGAVAFDAGAGNGLLDVSIETLEGSATTGFFVTNDRTFFVNDLAIGFGDADGVTGITAGGTVRLQNSTAGSDITLEDPIVAAGQLVSLLSLGFINSNAVEVTPANPDIDINTGAAGTIALRAQDGIGTIANPVEIDAGTLAFDNDANDVFITDRVTGIIIDDVDGITSSTSAGAIGLVADNIGATNNNSIRFSHNTIAAAGAVVATAVDTSGQTGDDIQVDGLVFVQASGAVTLSAGDIVNLLHTSTVNAGNANSLTVNVDVAPAGNLDPGSGGTANLFGTLNAGAIVGNGGTDNDTFIVFPRDQLVPTGADSDSINAPVTLDGAEGNDLYRIHNGNLNGGAADVTISDTGVEGAGTSDADNAIVYHTRAAETIQVKNDNGSGAAMGGFVDNETIDERVNYTITLDRIESNGGEFQPGGGLDPNDDGDMFFVQPSQSTRISIHGNEDEFGAGADDVPQVAADILDFDSFLNPFSIIGKTIFTANGAPAAFEGISFRNIEDLPLRPIGTSATQRFDMNAGNITPVVGQSPTETNYTPIYIDTFYGVNSATAGWVIPNVSSPPDPSPFAGFDLEVGTAGQLYHDLVRDGHVLAGTQTFQTDVINGWYLVSVKTKDANGMVVTDVDHNLALTAATTKLGRAETNFPVLVEDGTLTISFSNITPLEVLGVEVRPGQLLTIGSPEPGALAADGATIDTFMGFDAEVGDIITISAGIDSDGDDLPDTDLEVTTTDARPDLAGVQVIADANGRYTYNIRRPTSSGTAFILHGVFNGRETGCTAVDYVAPSVRRFDFQEDALAVQSPANGNVAPDEVDGYVAVLGGDTFDHTRGYGWSQVVSTASFDNDVTINQSDLTREIHTSRSATFSAEVANDTYTVNMFLSQPSDKLRRLSVLAEGVGVISNLSTETTGFNIQTFDVMVTDGVLNLEISVGGGQFSISGMEIRPAASINTNVTVATVGAPGLVTADGTSNDTITGTAPANSVITVSSTLGTPQAAQDIEPNIVGVQVQTNGAGAWSAIMDRPSIPGTPTITVATINGLGQVTVANNAILQYQSNLGAGLFFDMQLGTGQVQSGFIATGAETFDPLINAGFLTSVGGTALDQDLVGTDYSALLRDSVADIGARVFRLDFDSAQTLDATYNFGGDSFNATVTVGTGTALTNLISPPSQASHAAHVINSFDIGGGIHRIEITFSETTATGAWQLFGASFRPVATLLNPTIATPGGSLEANNTTVDNFGIGALSLGRTYTISTTGGTITLADDDPHIEGIQHRAMATTVTVGITRPAFGQTSTITVADVVGSGRFSATQVYVTPVIRRIDFNGATDVTETGFIGVQRDTISGVEAFGWLNFAAQVQDRGIPVAGVVSQALYRDSAQAEATFRIAIDALAYDFTFYTGDKFEPSHVAFSVEGGAFTATSTLTLADAYTRTTLAGVTDQNADGFLDITFSHAVTTAVGFVNGFDIAVTTMLPGEALLLAESIGTGGDVLDAATLDTVVDQAIAEFAATGLNPDQIDALKQVTFEIEDLGGRVLGSAGTSHVLIDDDAAGHGWGTYAEPNDDSDDSLSSIDLLTVVLHELGHTLGYEDEDVRVAPDSLMAGTLGVGEHRTADSLFMNHDLFNHFD
jgi:hypothetical protein